MKVTVLTLVGVANYGTQLQALATQEKLSEYFDKVELINYKREDNYGSGLINSFSKGNIIKAAIIIPTIFRWNKIFGEFQKKNLHLTTKKFYSSDDFINYKFDCDAFISGSDQVWNSGWNGGIIPEMYLSFAPNNSLKFALSSSFGKSTLSDNEVEETKKYIMKYNLISVREDSGLNIMINQYKYKNAIQLIDPTLSLQSDYWKKFGNKSNLKIKEDYILIYNLNRSKEFDQYAKKLSKKTGLKVYRFCTRYDQVFRYGKSLVIPKIEDFVYLIMNAKYVLTDSFHATAFSMNLNVKPLCIYPEKYSSRLSDFLKLVDAECCHVNNYDDFNVVNRNINFNKINKILDIERKKYDNYLSEMKKMMEDKIGEEKRQNFNNYSCI